MKELGLAVLNKVDNDGFDPSRLGAFNDGGVSEVAPVINAQVISIESLLRAEQNLDQAPSRDIHAELIEHDADILELFRRENHDGSAIDTPDKLTDAHVKRGHDDNEFHDEKVHNYSVGDVAREQNGGVSDGNLSSAGGYLKKGTTDPDAHERKEKKKFARFAHNQTLNEQQKLTEQLAELEEHIAALQEKIAAYQESIDEMAELIKFLEDGGDLNGTSKEAKKNRTTYEGLMRQRGIEVKKDENGKIDYNKDRVIELAEDKKEIEESGLSKAEEELQIEQDKLMKLQSQMANGSGNIYAAKESPALSENNYNESYAEDTAPPQDIEDTYAMMGMSFESIGDDMSFSDMPAFDMPSINETEPLIAFNMDDMQEISQDISNAIDTPDTVERSIGSFSGEGSKNIISAQFTQASDPELAQQTINELKIADQGNTLEENSTGSEPVYQAQQLG